MALVYKNRFVTQIAAELAATDLTMRIPVADYPAWTEGMVAGDFYYAVLIDDQATQEIVKIKFDGSAAPDMLAIERGQEGTGAKPWARGSYIYQDITSAMLEELQQTEIFRQGAFNPNAALSALYFGEEFYQTDLRLWWKSVGQTSEWRLIVGEILTADPVIFPASGSYGTTQLFEITSITPGADIYYTTDGSNPDENSTPYTVPFTLPEGTFTVKAIAYGPERWFTPSGIVSEVYTISSLGTEWVIQDTASLRPFSFNLFSFNGNLYGQDSGFLYRWDNLTGWNLASNTRGCGGSSFNDFVEHNGKMYIACGNGRVLEYNGVDDWSFDLLVSTFGISYLTVHNGVLYYATRNGLYRYNEDLTWTRVALKPSGTNNCRGIVSFQGDLWWAGDDGVLYIFDPLQDIFNALQNPAPGTPLTTDFFAYVAVDPATNRLYTGTNFLLYHDGSDYFQACNPVETGSIESLVIFGNNVCFGRFLRDPLFYWDGAAANEIVGTISPPAVVPPSVSSWWSGNWAIHEGTIWGVQGNGYMYKWA